MAIHPVVAAILYFITLALLSLNIIVFRNYHQAGTYTCLMYCNLGSNNQNAFHIILFVNCPDGANRELELLSCSLPLRPHNITVA